MTRQTTHTLLHRRTQRGLTMVELMVALTVSLLLLGGVIQIYASSKQSYRMNEALSRVQESGRFAIEFLSRDIRMAGFFGCLANTNPFNWLNGGAYNFQQGGISGTDGGGNNPDTIVLRGAYSTGINVDPPYMNKEAANIKVPAESGLALDEIVLISDCTNADVFQINAGDPSTGTVVHNKGEAGAPPGNAGCSEIIDGTTVECEGNSIKLSKSYGESASVYRVNEYTYSIQNDADGIPGLYRSDNAGGAVELVQGVENMQVLYGEDTDNDANRVANRYVPAGTANMDDVVSVRISLLLRTVDDNITSGTVGYFYNGATVANPGDRRLRRVFTATITLRNRAP